MYPLLKRDGLALAYAATMLAWLVAWPWWPRRPTGDPRWLQTLLRVAIPVRTLLSHDRLHCAES
jgi:hypothetical protein